MSSNDVESESISNVDQIILSYKSSSIKLNDIIRACVVCYCAYIFTANSGVNAVQNWTELVGGLDPLHLTPDQFQEPCIQVCYVIIYVCLSQ